jgi:2-oxoisovalerate dehydrogenase E2 component (dihydrolipoyl transacylase)
VQERCFYHLEAPVERVTGWDTPYPHAYEWAYFPGPKRMKKALRKGDGGLMARYEFKLPDIGEGIAEAEIVAWHVKVGDRVEEDQQLADMMTDKATVEMESPVAGKVVELAGEVGDQIPIGSVLAVIETDAKSAAADRPKQGRAPLGDGSRRTDRGAGREDSGHAVELQPQVRRGEGKLRELPDPSRSRNHRTSRKRRHESPRLPAVRARARDLGIDLGR